MGEMREIVKSIGVDEKCFERFAVLMVKVGQLVDEKPFAEIDFGELF